jgi:hypothetical protein
MKAYIDILNRIIEKSNNGLEIICDECPAAAEVTNTPRKKFRLRSDENTPSAMLLPPKDSGDSWHVVDYGLDGREGYMSAIDLYMWNRGWSQDKFAIAIQELAERYGVQEELKQGKNMPVIAQRTATADEQQRGAWLDLHESFGNLDLKNIWGPCVKAEHLSKLGWHNVRARYAVKDDKLTIRTATAEYPIFAQKCQYTDAAGNEHFFWKVYEPKNYEKAFRFMIIGQKPQEYIFGLEQLIQAYHLNNDEKLSEVLLVSGGSDAVNALSMGYQPVWLDSETRQLTAAQLALLHKYTYKVIAIPDIDETGTRMGISLAKNLPTLYTSWLTHDDFYGTHDNRGRQCKDLKDYLRLHATRQAMQQLVGRRRRAQFWTRHKHKDGSIDYSISETSLAYFLWLYGYSTLKDDSQKEPQYIRVAGHIVRRVKAKSIHSFLKRWCDRNGLSENLQNKLLASKAMPKDHVSHLIERDDLDFSSATATSQLFYFSNGAVEVTADKMIRLPATATGHHVWEDAVIPHDFRPMQPQFTVSRDDNGNYRVTVSDQAPSKLLRFLANSSRLYWRKADELQQTLTDEEQQDEEQCLLAKLTCIGYLLHSYKSESESWAPILLDSTMGESTDECNGRSGKSFFLNAIGKLISTFLVDARVKSVTENRFIFDGVTESTNLIVVDECHRQLDYDFFFGKITGDLRGEEKGNHPFLIPFSKSPKLAFATNYVLQRHDPSTMGRLWPQLFSDYYHVATKQNDYRESRGIRDDFGQNLMGTDYTEQDWQADIALMLQCLQLYLSLPKDDRKQMPPMSLIERREKRAVIGKDFEQWATEYLAPDSGNLDTEIKSLDMLANFNLETKYGWSLSKFTRHLKDYCEYADHIHCLNPATKTGRKADGMPWVKRENGSQVRYYYIQSVPEDETQPKVPEPEEEIMIF